MIATCRRMVARVPSIALLCVLGFALSPAHADDAVFKYDALGRLITVERSDGTKTIYTLDPAGNRTEVKEGSAAGIPASITVPASSTTGSYTISWTAPSTGSVTAYELYESTSSSFATQTLVYSGTALSKSLSSRANGSYYYRVRACAIDCSAYRTGSNRVDVIPGTPASINVPAVSTSSSYTISWGAASGSFSTYQLEESTSSSFSSPTQVYSGSATSANVTGKSNGGTYYYRVRACGNGMCGAYRTGGPLSVQIAPGVPASISVPATAATGDYSVSWGAASGSVSAYELYEDTSSSFTNPTRVHNATATVWSVTGKPTGTYYYRVRACYQTSCSGYTTGANGVLVDRAAPSAPGTPTYTVNGTAVTLSWAAASDNVGVTSYEYRLDNAAQWQNLGLVLSRTLTGLVANTTYLFEVRAKDAAGNLGSSSSVSFKTGIDVPPQPTGLVAAPSSQCSWRASWSATSGATYYQFKRAGVNEAQVTATVVDISFSCVSSSFDATKPEYVKACNSVGCSLPSNFTIGDTTKPSPPSTPQVSNLTPTGATLSWSPAFDASGIALYQYRLVGVTSWTSNGTTTSVVLSGLSPSTSYTFELTARDTVGLDSDPSSVQFMTPAAPDTTGPTAPGNLSIDQLTYSSARATWTAASDNVGVTGYEWRRTGQQSWTWIGNVLTISMYSLTAQTPYTFEVRARDGAGNAGTVASVNFTTLQAPPNKPSGLFYGTYMSSWAATWNAVDGATYYMLRDTQGNEKRVEPTAPTVTGYITPPAGDMNSQKPKSVRACNAYGCSTDADFP